MTATSANATVRDRAQAIVLAYRSDLFGADDTDR